MFASSLTRLHVQKTKNETTRTTGREAHGDWKLKDKIRESMVLIENAPEMDRSTHQKCENLYRICANIVHPYDSDYADFLKVLFDLRHSKKDIQGCCEILRLILKNQYQNLPKYYSQIGITEMVAAKNCNSVNFLEEGELKPKFVDLQYSVDFELL